MAKLTMRSIVKPSQIFDAARNGDLETTRACLEAGARLATKNEFGFTALHCAAMGANTADLSQILSVMRLLIDAGSPLESLGGGGRTPLYLAAEFSPSVEPIQLLLDAGANPDTRDDHGIHIVANGMTPEAQELLSRVTGEPVPERPPPKPQPIKMTNKLWHSTKRRISSILDQLSEVGLVTLQDAGYTQEDGLTDCAADFRDRGGTDAGLQGICFYTRQDSERAKQTSQLTLAFWGAPAGQPKDMERVGWLIVNAFQENGFTVDWDGSGGTRPTVYLQQPE